MVRSILSVLAGYGVIVVIVMVTTVVSIPFFTSVTDPQSNWSQVAETLGNSWYLFEIAFSAFAGFAGGLVTALLARRSLVGHTVALAGVMLAMGGASVAFSRGFQPAWHSIIVTLGGVIACVMGGFVISRRGRNKLTETSNKSSV